MARSPDEQPRIEVLTGQQEVGTEDDPQSGGRTGTVVAAVLIAVVVAGLVSFGGDRPADVENADDGMSTSLPATTVDGESGGEAGIEPDVEGAVLGPRPPLGRSFDASILLGGGEAGWRTVDLATGTVREIVALDGVRVDAIVPVRGGVIVHRAPLEMPTMVPFVEDGVVEASPFVADLDEADVGWIVDLYRAGPDRVWAVTAPPGSGDSERGRATLVDLDGTRLAGPIEFVGTAVGATADRIVVEGDGGLVLAGSRGIESLGFDTPVASALDTVAGLTCDEVMRCFSQVVDVFSGDVRRSTSVVSTGIASPRAVLMVLSDDGSLVTVPGFRHPPHDSAAADRSTALIITPRDGESVPISLRGDIAAPPSWLSDGSGVVVLTDTGVVHVTIESGMLAARSVDGIPSTGADAIFVVPHS